MRTILRVFLVLAPVGPAVCEVDFAREVRPILNKHCLACHGGVKEAGEVSFIYREQALGTGESGKRVVIPGDPDASEMMVRIQSDDPDEVMPKPEHGPPLEAAEIEVLRRWIKEGAPWGEHWSFVSPVASPTPEVRNTDWPLRDLDYFILGWLESEDLAPSPPADKAALLRRASLDLTGLPPTIAELEAFLADSSPDAYEKQVDRLLASPDFGERWASVWMDLARYADSEGLGADRPRTIWKYRDWIIKAFNRDYPFDQFTIDQLAGDLIPQATLDQKIATAFHRLTQLNTEGGTDDEEFRVAAVLDRINTTGEVWQGLTLGCVQCHSHPYDPIKHGEYYELMAFFNQSADADLEEDLPKLAVPLDDAHYTMANKLHDEITSAEKALHAHWLQVDQNTTWKAARSLSASADKATLAIVERDGIEEYRADSNVAAGAVYRLTFPVDLPRLTAVRVEFLPLDEKKARHTPEWGAILKLLTLETIDSENVATRVPLAGVVADEPHPFFDPNGSLKNRDRAWGTYSKFFKPRHATFILSEALEVSPDTRLRVTMHNGGSVIASFPMVSKRGRLAVTDHPEWVTAWTAANVLASRKTITEARKALREIPSTTVPVMRDRTAAHARDTHQFIRGNWIDKGSLVEKPGTPRVFPALPPSEGSPTRLDLARWIASPENPLTARVAVNRFWLELFGTGIVPTPEDFGSAGERPTHPELLDTLAVRFATEMKWSMKSLLRELATSATYRQDATVTPALAERDPGNRLLARGPRQRLTAEMTRDHALVASGLLSSGRGGPPSRPPLPPGVWTPFSRDDWNTPKVGDPERYRRSVYTYWKRSIPYPSFATFDAPSRERCSNRRLVSNTPLQALTVLNDPVFHECAGGLARRMKDNTVGSLEDKLSLGYRAATSRRITPDRLAELRTLFRDLEDQYTRAPEMKKGLAGSPDGAAFTVVASVLLNLDEALTR